MQILYSAHDQPFNLKRLHVDSGQAAHEATVSYRVLALILQEANVEVQELEEDLKDIDEYRRELAVFFCEDVGSFKLEDCFKTLQTFCERFKKAIEVSRPGEMKWVWRKTIKKETVKMESFPNSGVCP